MCSGGWERPPFVFPSRSLAPNVHREVLPARVGHSLLPQREPSPSLPSVGRLFALRANERPPRNAPALLGTRLLPLSARFARERVQVEKGSVAGRLLP